MDMAIFGPKSIRCWCLATAMVVNLVAANLWAQEQTADKKPWKVSEEAMEIHRSALFGMGITTCRGPFGEEERPKIRRDRYSKATA